MLTRNMIQASSAASEKVRYYTEDESVVEYYNPDAEQSIGGDSIWLGALANELGLSGTVLKDELTAMMFGHAPDGTAIRWDKQRKDQEQRLVLDACLSPPKSWSIASLVCGEKVLIEIHKEVVTEVVKLIEDRLAAARIQIDGHRASIQTKNLAIAALTHYTARPVKELNELLKVDPQLHTHILIMNGTRCPDGTYRALHTEMLCAAIGLDNIYKNKLAQKAVEHGFAIRNTPNGFELQAISDELIEVYSSRRTLAKALCQKQGLPLTPDNIEKMTLRSRMAKKLPKTLEEMMTEWAEQGKQLGLAGIPKDENATIEGKSAREMLDSAIRHYSERSTSFTREDIELYVFQHPQKFGEQELGREIYCHSDLIPLGERYTTHTALKTEQAILNQWFQGQEQSEAFSEGIKLEHDLNERQRAVVHETLTCRDRDQIWQGISGAGKTRSLGALKKELDIQHVEIRGFAPGIQESKELAKELHIETNTVASLVLHNKGLGRNQLWIIDEAGKLSTKQLKVIQDKAELMGSRLLLVGDKGQNAAIEAGSPFRQLQTYGATTHKLDIIVRQKDEIQRQAVELVAQAKPLQSFDLLLKHEYVTEIKDPLEKAQQIATDYLSLSNHKRLNTIVVAGTNKDAEAITTYIRDGFRAEGLIAQEDIETQQLVSRQLTTEQKQQLYNYQKGNFIRLHGRNQNKTLKIGELYKVTAIHDNDLTLVNANGKYIRFSPKRFKNLEVYRTQKLDIAVGDRLRWTHSNKKVGRINGATVEVIAIDADNIALVRSVSGKMSTIDLSHPVDVAHALVSTSYRAQGQTAKRVLISATADPTSRREPFYVAISRQQLDLKIYTQSIEKLRRFIPQTNAQHNAQELINEQRRIEAERHANAIKSLRNYRHQHPFIFSAVASLTAGAIRKNADQGLVRQELERLYQALDRANRGIKQLNGLLSRQNRPNRAQKLELFHDYQAIEAELDLFLEEFEQDIRHTFGPALKDRIESYSLDAFDVSEPQYVEAESVPLGEYCPVDIPGQTAIAPESRAAEQSAQIPGRIVKTKIDQTNSAPIASITNSRFHLVQAGEAELEVSTTLELLEPELSKRVNVETESANLTAPQVFWSRSVSLNKLEFVDRPEIDQIFETHSHHSVLGERAEAVNLATPFSARSPLAKRYHSPASQTLELSSNPSISAHLSQPAIIEKFDSFETPVILTENAIHIEILQNHSELRELLNISNEQAKRQPQSFITRLVNFETTVLEAEKLGINPFHRVEDSIISIETTRTPRLQALEFNLAINDESHQQKASITFEMWPHPSEPQLFTTPQVAFNTAILAADELGITHSVQVESGKSKASDIILEIWNEETAVLTLDEIESTLTLQPATSKPQLLNLGTEDFNLERVVQDKLIFSQAPPQALKVSKPAISSKPLIIKVDEQITAPTNQITFESLNDLNASVGSREVKPMFITGPQVSQRIDSTLLEPQITESYQSEPLAMVQTTAKASNIDVHQPEVSFNLDIRRSRQPVNINDSLRNQFDISDIKIYELEIIPMNQIVFEHQNAIDINARSCRFIADPNNTREMEPQIKPIQAPTINLQTQHQSKGFNHDGYSNQSHQRTVNDGDREPEALNPTIRPANRAERFSNSEPIDSQRSERLYGESHQQRETSTVQSFGDGSRLEGIDREGYSRGLGKPKPYPRQRQLNHGQSAIPQPDHDRNRSDTYPATHGTTGDNRAEHNERDWTDALAEYRVLEEVATPLRDVVHALQQLQHAKEELRKARLMRVVPKPVQIPIFWDIKYNDRDRPDWINSKDWEEFKASAIHPDLIHDNLQSIQGIPVMGRLLESRLAKMGSGQFPTKKMTRLMDRYQALVDAGGWWGKAGVDPLNNWKPSTWGCFKGDQPRIDEDGEPIKYEHPLGVERQFYLPHIRDNLATRILAQHGIQFQTGDCFWKTVHERNLPITYIEGYKKALAALSQGEIAIGLSGVNALYIANEKVNGEKFKLAERRLTPPAQVWATPGREIKFAFDQDTKITAILNVRRDMVRAIELHSDNECKVVNWNASQGKGIDDLIVESGPRAFTKAIHRAIPADKAIKAHYRYQYNRLKKRGLSDPQIWLKACRDNDIKDGDRYLAQSNFVRANPAKATKYIKQQKTIALQAMKRESNRAVSRKRITTKGKSR